jgi:hypothetical protein
VNMEELKMGLRLSPVKVVDVEETVSGSGMRLSTLEEEVEEPSMLAHYPRPAESLHLVPAPDYNDGPDDESDSGESSIFEDDVDVDVDVDDLDVEEPNVEILQQSCMLDSSPLPIPPQLSPLRDSSSAGNRAGAGQYGNYRKRNVDFTTIMEENTWDLGADMSATSPVPPPHGARPRDLNAKLVLEQEDKVPASIEDFSESNCSLDSILLVKPIEEPVSKPPPVSAPSARVTKDKRSERERVVTRKPAVIAARTGAPIKLQPPSNDGRVTPPTGRNSRPVTSVSSSSGTADSASTGAINSSTASSVVSTVSSTTNDHATKVKGSDNMLPPPPPSAQRSPRRVNSRLPLPRTNGAPGQLPLLPPPQQSPLNMATIAAKLAASERDADAARVRAKLKAARQRRKPPVPVQQRPAPSAAPVAADLSPASEAEKTSTRSNSTVGDEKGIVLEEPVRTMKRSNDAVAVEDGDEILSQEKPRKRERRTSKVANRRRSTLNPWELKTLITGTTAGAPPLPGLAAE